MASLYCLLCSRNINNHCYHVKCCLCLRSCHVKCLPLFGTEDYLRAKDPANLWSCSKCNSIMFPFNNHDDEDFDSILSELNPLQEFTIDNLEERVFSPFEFENIENDDPLNECDPDSNFYNISSCGTLKPSKYYTIPRFVNEINTDKIKQTSFSLIHTNIRSSKKNLSDFLDFITLTEYDFSCIGLSETWLTEYTVDAFDLPGYSHITYTRSGRIGGGVSIYLKNNLTYSNRNDLQSADSCFETVFIEVNKENTNAKSNVIYGVIYRPPDSDIEKFTQYINTVLNTIKKEGKLAYLMGDYNINLLNSGTHTLTNQFVDMMFTNSFVPLINQPTRITKNTATLIDNIFTNDIKDSACTKGIFYTDITDHFPVFYIDSNFQNNVETEYIYKRFFSDDNVKTFRDILSDSNLDNILTLSDPQTCMTILHEALCKAHNIAFPLKKIRLKYRNRKPWLTDALKTSIKRKNVLYIALRKHYSPEKETYYKRYKNQLSKIVREAERKHYLNLLTKEKDNFKKSWNVLKEIINKNKQHNKQAHFIHNNIKYTKPADISEKFNDYFVNIGPTLASKITNVSDSAHPCLNKHFSNNFFLTPTDSVEVNELVKTLKLSSPGHDNITSNVLQSAIDIIGPSLAHTINASFSTGVFPKELKISNVIPLFKSGESSMFTNYRPVSLLSTLSKVFEKLFYKRLLSFLKKYNILYSLQFGFRQEHSTYMAHLVLIDKIIDALENNEFAIGVFLDFSKAFDTVDHSILLNKMEHYGIRGTPLKWIQSYLTDRYQYTSFNGASSQHKLVSCGVPQGSVLGPLLFLLYVNDLALVSPRLFTILFADDTNMFITGTNLNDIVEELNIELKKIVHWLKVNKLSLNIQKTQYMIFHPKN